MINGIKATMYVKVKYCNQYDLEKNAMKLNNAAKMLA